MGQLLYPEAIERVRHALDIAGHDFRYLSAVGGDGPVAEFEKAFQSAAGGKYAIACSNATSALLTALMASGVGKGDEVILPAYTWPQTLSPILMTGATPVFADIEEDSVTISPLSIQRLMTKRTKAIVAVHIYGIPADIAAIGKLAEQGKCVTIYDAAQGFGALYDGRPVGSFGDFVAFSFGRNKLVMAGEGGALICNSREGYERAIAFSQHPLRMHRHIDNDQMREGIDGVSLNFRMHPLVASLALGQMEGMNNSGVLNSLRENYIRLRDVFEMEGANRYLPVMPMGTIASGIAFPLIAGTDPDMVGASNVANRLGYETYTAGVQTPLHVTTTIRERAWLCRHGIQNKERLPIDNTHAKKYCPYTERRCAQAQLFVKMALF